MSQRRAANVRAFLRGMGRALDLGGWVRLSAHADRSDFAAIEQDWRAVVGDLTTACGVAHGRLVHGQSAARKS